MPAQLSSAQLIARYIERLQSLISGLSLAEGRDTRRRLIIHHVCLLVRPAGGYLPTTMDILGTD